ncbi:hypothetical protein OnM2_024117 [Erysiphe neolycopersici]|uniref:Uncharacterized protein n=1 Tax=Erysiphe neolycopersici TaxID=212602 RepID=A0A420I1K8_9PEZI|nr:hypothetical protein OnM2_024117 [Erysiphe neolycopersici]
MARITAIIDIIEMIAAKTNLEQIAREDQKKEAKRK